LPKPLTTKEIQAVAHYNTIFSQMLKIVPRHELESCVRAYQGDKWVKHFSCWNQFVALLFFQMTGRKSLRDLVLSLSSKSSRLYHLGFRNPKISRSTLSDANRQRPYEIYEQFFLRLSRIIQGLPQSHGFRFKNKLYAFDATVVDLCLSLYQWAGFRKQKGAVKLHTLLNLSGNVPSLVNVTDGKTHEVNMAHRLRFQPGDIVVWDRAFTDYNLFAAIEAQQAFFVIRQKANAAYKILKKLPLPRRVGLLSDQIIEFTGYYKSQDYPHPLRRIRYRDPESGKTYTYLTNCFNLSPATIAAIYKQRWQVELFFKWVKQQLKIKSFLGTSENAVKTQIYIALCAYLLLRWLKHLAKTGLSMLQITRLIQINIFARRRLYDLLTDSPGPLPPSVHGQLILQGF